jgi:hypothetical protein
MSTFQICNTPSLSATKIYIGIKRHAEGREIIHPSGLILFLHGERR